MNALYFKLILLVSLFLQFSCKEELKIKEAESLQNISEQHTYTEIYQLTCLDTLLSNQFNLKWKFHKFSDTISNLDSNSLMVKITDKATNSISDSLFLDGFHFGDPFSNCNAVRSYSTSINSKAEIIDNNQGDIVVADLNFDGLDDLAIAMDYGGNSGPVYVFYIQTESNKFVQDQFLTDSIMFFPDIDSKSKLLRTFTHANAYELGEHTFQYNVKTKTWYKLSHRLLPVSD
ncbi:MAG: hypothetical protein EP332_01730 [Bacteroidetes bacterium]|nr:MAG: hypothetical protein EP332_01730 [Bacteroidota bacterium]